MTNDIRTVLVTGGAGYIGSVLTGMLLEEGYRVVVLDRLFFGPTLAHLVGNPNLKIVKDDIRWFDPSMLQGVDAVLDLAALSNDPVGELNPEKTYEINYKGRVRVANLARQKGVKRYVLASSCSIYGFQEEVVDETSTPNPLTTYSKANYQAEQEVIPLASKDFVVTVLRQASVYGASLRMRFDTVVNGMTVGLFKTGKLPILRDGSQWRPIVHVKDTCRAFIAALEAELQDVNGELFNVGADEQNVQILPLAERVAKALGRPLQIEWYGFPDHRSYRTTFKKIEQKLGYKTLYSIEDGVGEIYTALEAGRITDGPTTRTVEWYKTLQHWQGVINSVTQNGVIL